MTEHVRIRVCSYCGGTGFRYREGRSAVESLTCKDCGGAGIQRIAASPPKGTEDVANIYEVSITSDGVRKAVFEVGRSFSEASYRFHRIAMEFQAGRAKPESECSYIESMAHQPETAVLLLKNGRWIEKVGVE